MEAEIKGEFRFEQDSKRYHRFTIITDNETGIVGNVYVPKIALAMPDRIVLKRGENVGAENR